MSKYVDVYILPIAEENVAAYKKMAKEAGKYFIKYGALTYREYVGSDLESGPMIPFPKMAKAKPGETVIYAAVEFKSEAHRNKVMKAVMKDADMSDCMGDKPLFDFKRMAYGGFKILVDL